MNCHRHPDRETGVSCQRCDRYICPECQTPSAVGFLCPEDAHVPVKQRVSNVAVVTYSLIALNVLAFALQFAIPSFTSDLFYASAQTHEKPWTMLTSGFLHSMSSPTHILFNMYSLFLFGRLLESMLGKGRFLALYLISIFGGSVGVLILSPGSTVIGASGGIFGLMGAYFVIMRSVGQTSGGLVGVIALNLVIGFIPGFSISWQAHVGGLVVGGLIAFIYSVTRKLSQRLTQVAYVFLIVLLLIGASFVGAENASALVPF